MGTALAKTVCVVVVYLQADLITLVRNRIGSVKNMTVSAECVFNWNTLLTGCKMQSDFILHHRGKCHGYPYE
jgi:hypothetical protein